MFCIANASIITRQAAILYSDENYIFVHALMLENIVKQYQHSLLYYRTLRYIFFIFNITKLIVMMMMMMI